jgi:hypothetical protein
VADVDVYVALPVERHCGVGDSEAETMSRSSAMATPAITPASTPTKNATSAVVMNARSPLCSNGSGGTLELDQADARVDHDGTEDRIRQVGEQSGEQEDGEEDQPRCEQ